MCVCVSPLREEESVCVCERERERERESTESVCALACMYARHYVCTYSSGSVRLQSVHQGQEKAAGGGGEKEGGEGG